MTHFDAASDSALDALLARTETGVLQSVTDSLDTTRGAGLVHWHAVPTENVPLPTPPHLYDAFSDIHIHGDFEATTGCVAASADASDGRHTTLAELLITAYRDHKVLGELLGPFVVSGETTLLYSQLEARIECLHNRLVIPCNDHGLNGTRAAHLTLAVWASTCRIRQRLEHGEDDALPPGAVLQAIALCTSIINVMEIVRDTLYVLFGIQVTPVTVHSGFAGRFDTTVPR